MAATFFYAQNQNRLGEKFMPMHFSNDRREYWKSYR